MTKEQFEALKQWIEALIDERIGDAFGRDTLSEARRRNVLEADLLKELGL